MESDNPSGADNQQERLSSSYWLDRTKSDSGNRITGFVDGKGSFNVPNPSRVRSHRNVIRRSSGQVVVEAGKREMRSSIEDFDRAEAEAAIRWRHAA
jgi:hypothetical protein